MAQSDEGTGVVGPPADPLPDGWQAPADILDESQPDTGGWTPPPAGDSLTVQPSLEGPPSSLPAGDVYSPELLQKYTRGGLVDMPVRDQDVALPQEREDGPPPSASELGLTANQALQRLVESAYTRAQYGSEPYSGSGSAYTNTQYGPGTQGDTPGPDETGKAIQRNVFDPLAEKLLGFGTFVGRNIADPIAGSLGLATQAVAQHVANENYDVGDFLSSPVGTTVGLVLQKAMEATGTIHRGDSYAALDWAAKERQRLINEQTGGDIGGLNAFKVALIDGQVAGEVWRRMGDAKGTSTPLIGGFAPDFGGALNLGRSRYAEPGQEDLGVQSPFYHFKTVAGFANPAWAALGPAGEASGIATKALLGARIGSKIAPIVESYVANAGLPGLSEGTRILGAAFKQGFLSARGSIGAGRTSLSDAMAAAAEPRAAAYARNDPGAGVPGNGIYAGGRNGTSSAIDQNGVSHDFRYKAVEANDLIASHEPNGQPNKVYPEDIQPRDRQRLSSIQQMADIAKNLNPEMLLADQKAIDRGTPITRPDNVVLSGNGRAGAVKLAAADYPDSYGSYKQSFLDQARKFGFTPAQVEQLGKMRDPVLVRERVNPVGTDAEFARAANGLDKLQYGASEQANLDAGKINDNALSGLVVSPGASVDEAIRSPHGEALRNTFLRSIPKEDARGMMDANGQLSRDGLQRIKAALFAKTYPGDAGQSLLRTFTESTDPVLKNVESALFQSLPAMSRAEAMARSGGRDAALSLGEDLARAIQEYQALKGRGLNDVQMAAEISQRQSPSLLGAEAGALTPEQGLLLKHITDLGASRSPVRLRTFLESYAHAVEAEPPGGQGGLFGADLAANGKADLLRRAGVDVPPEPAPVEEPQMRLDQAPIAESPSAVEPPPSAVTAPAAAPVSAPPPPSAVAEPRLPRDLAGAKPTYQLSKTKFGSDVDKALFIVANPKTKSKRHDDYMAFLRDALPGKSDGEIRAEGLAVRRAMGRIKPDENGVRSLPAQDRLAAEPTAPAPKAVGDMTPAERQAEIARLSAVFGAERPVAAASDVAAGPRFVARDGQVYDTKLNKVDEKLTALQANPDQAVHLADWANGKVKAGTWREHAPSGGGDVRGPTAPTQVPPIVAEPITATGQWESAPLPGGRHGLVTPEGEIDRGGMTFATAEEARVAADFHNGTKFVADKGVASPTEAAEAGMMPTAEAKSLTDAMDADGVTPPKAEALPGLDYSKVVDAARAQGFSDAEIAELVGSRNVPPSGGGRPPAPPTSGGPLPSPDEVAAVTGLSQGDAASAIYRTFLVNSMLSVATTGLKAGADLGNTIIKSMEIAGRPLPGLSQGDAATWAQVPGELGALWTGLIRGMTDDAVRAWRSQRLVGAEGPQVGRFDRALAGDAGPGAQRVAQAVNIATLGQVNTKLISSMTAVFQRGFRDAFLYSEGYQNAVTEGLSGKAAHLKATAYMVNPTEKALARAQADATRRTWANKNELIAPLAKLRDKPGVGDVIFTVMPFVNLVSNLAADAASFHPGINAVGLARMGGLSAERQAELKVHAFLGGLVALYAATQAAAGNVTGDGPADVQKSIALANTGWKSNSVRVGGRWIPNRSLGPLGLTLDAIGNFHDQMVYNTKPQDRDSLVAKGTAMMTSEVKAGLDQLHWLNSAMTFLSAWKDGTERNKENAIAGIASDFTPQSGNLHLFESSTDPTTPDVSSRLPADQQLAQLYRRKYPGSGLPPGIRREYSGLGAIIPILGGSGPSNDPNGRPWYVAPEQAAPRPGAPPPPPPGGARQRVILHGN